MWTLLAESTVQMVKDQEGFCATFTVNAIETTISALCSRWNTVPGTAPALSFWQKHALWLRRYTDTEPLKKGLQPFPSRVWSQRRECTSLPVGKRVTLARASPSNDWPPIYDSLCPVSSPVSMVDNKVWGMAAITVAAMILLVATGPPLSEC